MHFFYLDESGCTGTNLADANQPIFVLGGISSRDEGWIITHDRLMRRIRYYFGGNIPSNFELHANELLSPEGEGPFQGHTRKRRNRLALDLLRILISRKHKTHIVVIDKSSLSHSNLLGRHPYSSHIPYLLAYDYLLNVINKYIKRSLGRSARGLVILDEKEQFEHDIDDITNQRRFIDRGKDIIGHIVEYSYPIDSKKNPMIQLSDLVVYCTKRYFEQQAGYRNTDPRDAILFYRRCYAIVRDRLINRSIVHHESAVWTPFDNLISSCTLH